MSSLTNFSILTGYASDQSVRLIGGSHHQEGIVEIAYNGRWGMLCNGRFQSTDAKSICQGLGFGTDEARVMSVSSTRYGTYRALHSQYLQLLHD